MSNRLGLTATQIRQLMARQVETVPVPKGSRALPGDLNRVEREFLETQLLPDPTVVDIWPHGIRLVLGDNSRYEPDFLIMRSDGTLEIFEIKAEWSNGVRGHDKSRGKVKASATLFPFRITIASKQSRKKGGGWRLETFEPARRHLENRTPAENTATTETPDGRRQGRLRVVPGTAGERETPVV